MAPSGAFFKGFAMKLFLLILILFTGCITLKGFEPRQQLSTKDFYRRDMIVEVNGLVIEGAGVVPRAEKYVIHVEARGNLDLFIMNTCHKEETKERAWNVKKKVKSGLFGWGRKNIDEKNKINFTYIPDPKMENSGDCAMELRGIEIMKGRHSFAFIEFESELDKIQAISRCNGRSPKVNGVAVCQSRHGLKQMLEFNEVVKPSTAAAKCGFTGNKKAYEYKLVKGKCVAIFKGQTTKQTFKIVTLGYEKILVRK